MTQAVIYCRFSPRPNAKDCDSNRKQFQRCRAYAKAHDYQIIGVRWDRDLSGGRADNRPGFQRAIAQACKAKAVLLVYKLDRFARSVPDTRAEVDRLVKAGADLASITETINTRSPMGRFFLTILAAFDELVREQIRERTSSAMLVHQANGRRMSRADRVPFGMKAEGKRLVRNPAEQEVIKIIRDLRKQGLGLRRIALHLEGLKLPCRGARWHPQTIKNILLRA